VDDVWSTVRKAGAVPGTTTIHCHRSLLWCQTTKLSVPNCQFQQPPPPIRQSRYFIITSELYTAVELPHNATIYRKSNPPVLHPCMHAPLTLFQSPLPNPVELIFLCFSDNTRLFTYYLFYGLQMKFINDGLHCPYLWKVCFPLWDYY